MKLKAELYVKDALNRTTVTYLNLKQKIDEEYELAETALLGTDKQDRNTYLKNLSAVGEVVKNNIDENNQKLTNLSKTVQTLTQQAGQFNLKDSTEALLNAMGPANASEVKYRELGIIFKGTDSIFATLNIVYEALNTFEKRTLRALRALSQDIVDSRQSLTNNKTLSEHPVIKAGVIVMEEAIFQLEQLSKLKNQEYDKFQDSTFVAPQDVFPVVKHMVVLIQDLQKQVEAKKPAASPVSSK